MSIVAPARPSIRGWTFLGEEVSMGVYTVRGTDVRGRTIFRTGTDYDALLADVWATVVDREYRCAAYFGSELASTGWWDEAAQYWYVEPVSRIVEVPEREFLDIGGPGVDGIRWGYRRGKPGVWAFYPIDEQFVFLASTAEDLCAGFMAGRVRV